MTSTHANHVFIKTRIVSGPHVIQIEPPNDGMRYHTPVSTTRENAILSGECVSKTRYF